MTDQSENPLDVHAAEVHSGFPPGGGDFEAARAERTELIRRFLAVMDAAGRPGLKRKLGSTVLQLTGQEPEHYWGAMLADGDGNEREVLVFDNGIHGWSDEITYSDRPRSPDDEIPPALLKVALEKILADNGLKWPDEGDSQPGRAGATASERAKAR